MSKLSERQYGPSGKTLPELTEQELLEERRRRREQPSRSEEPPSWQRVRQYLANLELSPGATWPDVERAYRRLVERYRPDKHASDPARHRAARELSESLTTAYRALRRHFERAER